MGAATKRRRPAQKLAYRAAADRSMGLCEICGKRRVLDPHHAFGRGASAHILGWAAEECVVKLCRDCHDDVTGRLGSGIDLDKQDRCRWIAYGWFVNSHSLNVAPTCLDPLTAMRSCLRECCEGLRPLVDEVQ